MFIRIELFKSLKHVSYYTVRLEQTEDLWDKENETDKFFKRFLIDPDKPSEGAELIFNVIFQIGIRGAKERYFRFENRANALPPYNRFLSELGGSEEVKASNLRLYCLRLSEKIVILLNGDEKTTDKAQDCPKVASHFRIANKIAQKVDEAIRNKELILQEEKLDFEDNFLLEI